MRRCARRESEQTLFTPNSDTPYALVPLDLGLGPMVVEVPPGAIIGTVNDLNERWVADLGLPGPDQGKGGKHLLVPMDWHGVVPEGHYSGASTTNRLIVVLRALPLRGDTRSALELIRSVRIRPLIAMDDWPPIEWIDISDCEWDATPSSIEANLGFWSTLHEIIAHEPVYEAYRGYYGELAALGIAKGKPFEPDLRMQRILDRAARIGNAQMRVRAFADRRPDRIAWPDRHWEWAALRPENGTFDAVSYIDLEAREKWFTQAVVESPAMFRRSPGAGSLYWLAVRDERGAFLEGGRAYRLVVPQPVPATLFWSVTVYDAETRSEIQTDQNRAALRSLFELARDDTHDSASETLLYFGPEHPAAPDAAWIKTTPGHGWFAYFRIYGPLPAAFDGSWKLGDLVELPLNQSARVGERGALLPDS